MIKYQDIYETIIYMRKLETAKLFLRILQLELITGYKPQELQNNQILNLKYEHFKYQYLKEIATSRAIIDGLNYEANLFESRNTLKYLYKAA